MRIAPLGSYHPQLVELFGRDHEVWTCWRDVCFKRITVPVHHHCKLWKCPAPLVLTFVVPGVWGQILYRARGD